MEPIATTGKAVLIVASISWLAFLSSPTYGLDNFPASTETCTCYYTQKDCASTDYCDIGLQVCSGTIVNGKIKDGLCKANPTPSPKGSPAEIVEALNLYFEAYLVPIRRDGAGLPDELLIAAAQSIPLGAQGRQIHTQLQDAVHLILDATIGFDFRIPQPNGCGITGAGEGAFAPGLIRLTPTAAIELVEAARDGMTTGILNGNLNETIRPLQEFWNQHPDFHPFHTGRYYPHGHDDYEEEVGTPLQGQIELLRRVTGWFRKLDETPIP